MSRFKNIFILPIFILILVLFALFTPSASRAVDPLGTWSNTESLPNTLASHISFSSGNKISVVGGANTIVIPTNISSVTNANGTLQPWSSSGSPLSLFWHSSAIKDDNLYILGGATYPPTVSLNTVYKGVINNQGIVTSWTLLTPLPKNLSIGAATVVGNRLYFAGGFTNGESTNQNVYFAPINANGTIGSWTMAGLLPAPMDGFGMVENGNNLIIVGGRNSNRTYKSAINDDGTLAGWQETNALLEAVHRSGVIRIGSTLLSIGGDNGGTFLDKIYYADINPDSTLGPWTLSPNHLPQPVCCGAVASSGNHIYLTGGFNGNYLNTVYMTQIGVANGEDKFDLPFSYVGRPTNDQGVFRSAFWQRLTAAFDHTFKGGIHRPFTGNTYGITDCLRGIVGIFCYDSHNGTDFDDLPDNPVYSVGSGEVIYTSRHDENSCTPNAGGFGCVVIVEYPSQGVFGLYAHLAKINVNAGGEVSVNDKLGKMGATGCPGCGTHLHFGVMKSLDASLSSVAKSMTKRDWDALLFIIRPFQTGGFRAFCSYRAPNGQRFSFQDPSGWKGENPDPWTLERPEGCGVESPYLWKLDVGTSSP